MTFCAHCWGSLVELTIDGQSVWIHDFHDVIPPFEIGHPDHEAVLLVDTTAAA